MAIKGIINLDTSLIVNADLAPVVGAVLDVPRGYVSSCKRTTTSV